jgi:hypothetical protein
MAPVLSTRDCEYETGFVNLQVYPASDANPVWISRIREIRFSGFATTADKRRHFDKYTAYLKDGVWWNGDVL